MAISYAYDYEFVTYELRVICLYEIIYSYI